MRSRSIFILAFLFALKPTLAHATCATGAMPFQLQNNTTADATQVMANFNQISSGVAANCAGSGINNDITALSALSTPINPTQGGTPVFTGGLTGGAPNAQTLTVAGNFTLTAGLRVTGIVGGGLTNTAAVTLNVNTLGAKNVFRKTQLGASTTLGGELIATNPFTAVYDGVEFILDAETIFVGEMRDWAGTTAPPGHFLANGTGFVCANFQALCTVIGTTYGGTGALPNLPDTRGRLLAGLDDYGGGAANRLTSAATGCGSVFTAPGATCANSNQSHTQIVAELAIHNHTDAGHTHTATVFSGGLNNTASFAASNIAPSATATTASGTAAIQNTGSSQAMPIVPHVLAMIKIIRF